MIPDITFIIISYNTKELIQECLSILFQETKEINKQVIVIDNGSNDRTFPTLQKIEGVEPIRIEHNIGFGAANNAGYPYAKGRYIVLLNSDAFPHSDAIQNAFQVMESHSDIGLLGGRLVGKDGEWQPSARLFPSLLNQFLKETGLANRFADSIFFGRADHTWASPEVPTATDWVPGAFCMIRKEALDQSSIFDERFFMYFEEVDLCKRIKAKGWKVQYWPDSVITHLGGETCKNTDKHTFNPIGAQVSLWQERSLLLYFRKHLGITKTWILYLFRRFYLDLRWLKNTVVHGKSYPKTKYLAQQLKIMKQAWKDTEHGKTSPPRPW